MSASTLDRYRSTLCFVRRTAAPSRAACSTVPLALALGVEARRESFATRLDPLSLDR